MQHHQPSSVSSKQSLAILLAFSVGMVFTPMPASAQMPGLGDEACLNVFGVGTFEVEEWIGVDPPEPFVIGGEFRVAIDETEDLVAYLDDTPELLTWYLGTFSLVAFPGSDAPLPGDLSWAPCSSTWELSRRRTNVIFDSFCESMLAPDPDEGDGIYEVFVREELAAINFPGTQMNCGRLYLNGQWDALAEPPGTQEEGITVSGKLCRCGARQQRIAFPF